MKIELMIQNGDKVYEPATQDGIVWTTERAGVPGKLEFSVLSDDLLQITEGNAVRLRINDMNLFYGFIFSMQNDSANVITLTVYDQLRYFKNKDTYSFEGKTASDIVKVISSDFRLNTGTIENSGYAIPTLVADNSTMFDMVQNALDQTLENTQNMFVLYDNFGKICLKNILSMQIPILIDEETSQNFSYSSSIDGSTFNKIKLVYENDETGGRDTYIAKHDGNIEGWGILQYFEFLQKDENGSAKADELLSLYNKKTKALSVSGAFGDTRVRAGCLVVVRLDLGNAMVDSWMLVESCKHEFKNNLHLMELNLRGGEFNG